MAEIFRSIRNQSPDEKLRSKLVSLNGMKIPNDIVAIPSNNSSGYKGVSVNREIATATISWKGWKIQVYKGNDIETAGKMFSWSYRIANGEDAYREDLKKMTNLCKSKDMNEARGGKAAHTLSQQDIHELAKEMEAIDEKVRN